MKQIEAWKTISNDVKHWYHEQQFKTYGDALGWWQGAEWEERVVVAGNKEGQIKFMDEVLYLITCFGPNAKIELPPKPRSKKPAPKTAPEPKNVKGADMKKKK